MKKLALVCLLMNAVTVVIAQDTVRNTGNLMVHAGGSLNTLGCFVNTSGSLLTNAGNLYLKNDLVNNEAGMSAGTGTLYLNGSSLQTISGSQVFKTYHLNTGNAAGLLLNNNLSVSGTHTFSAGLITTSATPNYLVYEDGALVAGDNDTRHVNGWVQKNGDDDFSFPVGDGVYERKAALSSLSVSSVFTCHYYKPTFNVFNLMSPLVQVKENEYWQINKQSGGTARITLNWDHSRVPMNHVLISEILVGYYTAAKWTSLGGTASGNVLTTGQVISSPVSNFGAHTIGYTNFPLPVTLISFTGERRNSVSILKWNTENEAKVDYFIVERSFDGINFVTAGQVKARNSGNQEQYVFSDPVLFNGQAYYRLKITDKESKTGYSGIIVLSEFEASDMLTIINPVQSQIQMQNRSGKSDTFKYRILNMSGQTLQTGSISMAGYGGAVIPLFQDYAKGLYQLELKGENNVITKKLLIE
jgi:hypothetical protein